MNEAVIKQGIDLAKRFNSFLFSVDDRCRITTLSDGKLILCVDKTMLRRLFSSRFDHITTIFHSTISDIIDYQIYRYGKFLFVLTSVDPVGNINTECLEYYNFVHLNNLGCIRIICHSEKSAFFLNNIGLYNVDIVPPYIQLKKYASDIHKKKETFCVGFASSPLQEKDFENKGFNYLLKEFEDISNCKLIIPWRSKDVDPPQPENNSVEIIKEELDISEFYRKISILIIPFLNEQNHAFPLSAIEALASGCVVLVSDQCGAASWVESVGGGLVFSPTRKTLSRLIKEMDKEKFGEKFNNTDISSRVIREIEKLSGQYDRAYHLLRTTPDSVTLIEWNRRLQKNGQHLIVGNKSIEKYYKKLEIVKNYDNDRFSINEQNNISLLEIKFVKDICKSLKTRDYMLDVAAGTGRFNQSYQLFKCSYLLDTSEYMHRHCQNSNWFDKVKCKSFTQSIFDFESELKFDAIVCFRLLRHLILPERLVVYRKFKTLLSDKGKFFIDVPLHDAELRIRNAEGWHNYNIYDFFWDMVRIEEELHGCGFAIAEKLLIPGKALGPKWSAIDNYQLVLSVSHLQNE
jgi:glycosyltransferase involved in cell wall biosynthesis/SAM-dependent methyltransferase